MKTAKKIFSLVFALCLISSLSGAFAEARSSAYLSSYSASCTATSSGQIAITVDVDGTGVMSSIGAKEIYLYSSTDNVNFICVASFTSDDYPEMLTSNASYYYDTPITYQGIIGRYYNASVYCYAAKNGGSDTRLYETASVQAVR